MRSESCLISDGVCVGVVFCGVFFFNDTATTEIYTLSLHDALPICWHQLTTTLEDQSQLTPLDVLVWGGGGLIGRRALELALSALPGLWPWLVGVTMAAVALGLYRWLFAPRRDGVFMARLFLALVGLAIGGQL